MSSHDCTRLIPTVPADAVFFAAFIGMFTYILFGKLIKKNEKISNIKNIMLKIILLRIL